MQRLNRMLRFERSTVSATKARVVVAKTQQFDCIRLLRTKSALITRQSDVGLLTARLWPYTDVGRS